MFLGLMAQSGFGQVKIGFIDLNRTFNEFSKTKQADAQLKDRADKFNAERKKMLEDYDALKEAIKTLREESQDEALSEDERKAKRDLAVDKLVELREFETKIRNFDAQRKKELEEQSKRERKRIIDEINVVLKDYAQNQGFTAVFDASGESLNQVPLIIYYDEKLDITEDILGIINAAE
ncbi:MAG: OmpH family outer membrane protein [Verrucomicrobiota bacterium]